MPQILIADDDVNVRAKVRSLLAQQTDWNVSEADNGQTAVKKLREERPEVVLLDLLMPSGNGIMAAYEIRQIAPSTKILFLTDQCGPEQASALAHLFGSGEYVPKSDMKTHLIPSISRLLKGPAEIPPERGLLPGPPPIESARSPTNKTRRRFYTAKSAPR